MLKRILSIFALMLTLITVLCSCGDDDGLPEGMVLGCDPDKTGYYFYIPEGWTSSNAGEISRAHVSSLDASSVSIAKMNSETVASLSLTGEWDTDKTVLADYTVLDVSTLPCDEPPVFVTVDGKSYEDCIFASKPAIKLTYTFNITDASTEKVVSFRTMQILVRHGADVYILTYQSTDAIMREDTSYYNYYYTFVEDVVKNFAFAENSPELTKNPEDTDGDGYYLASDRELAGFDLYLPNSFKLDYSSGLIGATVGESAYLTVTKATSTNVSILNYMIDRKAQLSNIFDDFTDMAITITQASSAGMEQLKERFPDIAEGGIKVDASIAFGSVESALCYEYTFSKGDAVYRVYQIYAIYGRSGYVFTYTAEASVYGEYIDAIEDVLERIVFE